jgi:hypothetical protein
MKRSLITFSIAAGLATAASLALADDKVSVMQTASNGVVTIDQIASAGNNAVVINQGDDWGSALDRNNLYVSQSAVGDSSIKASQSGSYSSYYISQRDGRNLLADVSSATGSSGNYNNVSSNSSARIVQFGNGGMNSASIVQAGDGNVAAIGQAGSNFTASIYQTGVGNTATINQGFQGYSGYYGGYRPE